MTQGKSNFLAGLGLTTMVLVSGLGAASAAQAAEQTINGFSVWDGKGTTYETGVGTATFVGAIEGTLFIETDKGPAPAGRMFCPALVEIKLATAAQTGRGKCTVIGEDGARIYADWTCKGVHRLGCDGLLELTGGTGRMAGVTGAGSLSLRTLERIKSASELTDGMNSESGTGILVLRDLTYALPEQ